MLYDNNSVNINHNMVASPRSAFYPDNYQTNQLGFNQARFIHSDEAVSMHGGDFMEMSSNNLSP